MIRTIVDRVAPAVGEVVVNCRDEQRGAIAAALSGVDYRVATDSVEDIDTREELRAARSRSTRHRNAKGRPSPFTGNERP